MGFSESHQTFAFKITPKAGGGFVSSSDNPALAMEAETKEELQQKVLQKIGDLGGPEVAAAIQNMGQIGPRSEKKISISINEKALFSFRKSKPRQADGSPQVLFPDGKSVPAGPMSEGGLSSLAKAAIVVAVVLLLLWLGLHR